MTTEKELFTLEKPHGYGEVLMSWQRGGSGFLATSGVDCNVHIYNRMGQLCERIKLKGLCTALEWDAEGDTLAIIANNSHLVTLWSAHTANVSQVDSGHKDPLCCIIWAKVGRVLAVGTAKGNLTIYSQDIAKRVPVLGKHSRRITGGAWSATMILALGSEDKSFSLSNVEGDTLKTVSLRAEPSHIVFSQMKLDERPGEDNTVSLLVGKKTLFLYNLNDPENPVELAFQARYGQAVTYKWFDDGYILLGFSLGFFIAISTHMKEVGQELFQMKNHKEFLTDVALNQPLRQVASAGDNQVKIHDMSNLHEVASVITVPGDESHVDRLGWSYDGQMLAVTCKTGSVYCFLSNLPMLSAAYQNQFVLLSNLTEIQIYVYVPEETEKPEEGPTIELTVEPSCVGVGPLNVAASMNNTVFFYDLGQPDSEGRAEVMRVQEYLRTVHCIKMNTRHAAVRCEGIIQLHLIEMDVDSPKPEVNETTMLPDEKNEGLTITCHDLTSDFLIYGTDDGHIKYFHLEDWVHGIVYVHTCGIRDVFADQSGERVAVIDDDSTGHIFNAIEETMLDIRAFSSGCKGILWDCTDKQVFVTYDTTELKTYVYVKHSIYGTRVELVGTTPLPAQTKPVLLNQGTVILVKSDGCYAQVMLSTHIDDFQNYFEVPHDKLVKLLPLQLQMYRFHQARKICVVLDKKEAWISFGEAALKVLDVGLAMKTYGEDVGDVGMALSLKAVSNVEDKALATGYCAMFLQQFDIAQKWFLASEHPSCALDMRRDLLQWESALVLAQKLAPDQVPFVAREYAQQLEFTGCNPQALLNYERGLLEGSQSATNSHLAQCRAGVARTAIRCGDVRRGVMMACEPDTGRLLKKECADILQTMPQHLGDAAMLYEKGGFVEQAASTYIRLKNWTKVGQLLPEITSAKIHMQFAKACEMDHKYEEALTAYQSAKDYDSMVRIYLEHFHNPRKAVEIVQEHHSEEGAKLVARHFQKSEDYGSAIRFLIVSGCHDQAFVLARQHNHLPLYGEILESQLTAGVRTPRPEDFVSLAKHFELEKVYLLAGKYYFHARHFNKALTHLMKASTVPENEVEALSLCIDTISVAKDDDLSKQLLDFLLGEVDGIAKDPKFIFRLYMALKQFKEASKTAVIIASDEQVRGNYRSAHDVLFGLYQELKLEGMVVPSEMLGNLVLLHLYTLARVHVKRGNHMTAARLLIRVTENISKFPAHVVPIITSTVIECSRAGLKRAAFTHATMLMRSEYRPQLDAKYVRKIETLVRKAPKADFVEPEEEVSPCPVCGKLLTDGELYCDHCKSRLPFCIATGRHIVEHDLTVCPHCNFPAIYTELKALVDADEPCPMCLEVILGERLMQLSDVRPYLYDQSEDYKA